MTEYQRFEETCMKCNGSKKCFANAMDNPDNSMRCVNYGIFKIYFELWLNGAFRKRLKKEVTDNAK